MVNFLIMIFIGIFPCILWLLFYLRQDSHPESSKKVIEVFFLGMATVIPVLILEEFFASFFPEEDILVKNLLLCSLYYILFVGFIEEVFKFIVVKIRVVNSFHFDEPIDAMIYLIVAGLGLAAIENMAIILSIESIEDAMFTSFIRLLTAIFLHTLAAAITGYFLALSFSKKKEKRKLIVSCGLAISSIFHGLYNISMIKLEEAQNAFIFLLPIVIIFILSIIVYFLFLKVKKLPRMCKF